LVIETAEVLRGPALQIATRDTDAAPGLTMQKLCARLLMALAVQAVAGLALAQGRAGELKQQGSVAQMTDGSKPDQGGKSEPGGKVLGPAGSTTVFVDGRLTAPGAPRDVDTAPAKFSARSAADDATPIVGYRLKALGEEARGKVHTLLAGKVGDARDHWGERAVLGSQVPNAVIAQGLAPVPQGVAAEVPELKDTSFTIAGAKVVLIDPVMRTVIGVVGP
jgi:hypothetical protein